MKNILLGLAVLTSMPAWANEQSTLVRCSGLNSDRVKIGADFELDPADRILSVTTFEADSTGVVDLNDLGAPSHFLRLDAKGNVQIFGFKSFNDGIDELFSITYVKNNPKLSVLKIGEGKQNLAVKNILCETLK